MGLISGLISIGRTLLTGGARVAAQPAARALAAGAVTGAGFVAAEALLGGDSGAGGTAFGPTGIAPAGQAIAPGSALAQASASGFQITPLSGGRFLASAPNGDIQVFNRNGMPVRPALIIPAGQRLPGGAVVVSTRNGGTLIGITKARRRKQFATKLREVRGIIGDCRAVLRVAEKPARRRSA